MSQQRRSNKQQSKNASSNVYDDSRPSSGRVRSNLDCVPHMNEPIILLCRIITMMSTMVHPDTILVEEVIDQSKKLCHVSVKMCLKLLFFV